MSEACRVVVLISGRGSNLQSLIDACVDNSNADIVAVISNRPDAPGLDRASTATIKALCVDHKSYEDRIGFEHGLAERIDEQRPDLILLAGFMRILSPEFVSRYQGQMLNIHPSLLPLYKGLHTHQRALDNGDREHGVTVHFVTQELDGGPSIIQARVPVLENDTEAALAARVLEQEHRIYPLALQWFADERLKLDNNRPMLDGNILNAPVQYDDINH